MGIDILKQVDELYRTSENPILSVEQFDSWSVQIIENDLSSVAGVIALDGSNVARLRRVQEIKEKLQDDVLLGPAYPQIIGAVTLSAYPSPL